MRIETGNGIAGVAASKRRSRSGSNGSFSIEDEADVGRSGTISGFSSLGGVDALLALQAVDPDESRQRQAIDHGRDILDTLESLKTDLLGGRIDGERLERLTAILRRRADHSSDPGLKAILAEIELRAHVELAKLGRNPLF
ncbi:MAG: flagellar assembly protein FliX [Rhodobiaceae bacterium]|nr:flagellar assembly protein FliX [Rhodobiaceae bacterium]MCC0055780.1 flagellar assembly protein FliX [Rhodobiaceae bacterium]